MAELDVELTEDESRSTMETKTPKRNAAVKKATKGPRKVISPGKKEEEHDAEEEENKAAAEQNDDDGEKDDDEAEGYEVERILKHRVTKSGYKFQVQWKNYPLTASTWEPYDNLEQCPEIRDEFLRAKNLSLETILGVPNSEEDSPIVQRRVSSRMATGGTAKAHGSQKSGSKKRKLQSGATDAEDDEQAAGSSKPEKSKSKGKAAVNTSSSWKGLQLRGTISGSKSREAGDSPRPTVDKEPEPEPHAAKRTKKVIAPLKKKPVKELESDEMDSSSSGSESPNLGQLVGKIQLIAGEQFYAARDGNGKDCVYMVPVKELRYSDPVAIKDLEKTLKKSSLRL